MIDAVVVHLHGVGTCSARMLMYVMMDCGCGVGVGVIVVDGCDMAAWKQGGMHRY